MCGRISLQLVLCTSLLACSLLRLAEVAGVCGPKEFECTNGNCKPIKYICDGDDDCRDNSDENVCDPFQCHPSAYQCSNGKCISRMLICNEVDDCGDNSDEQMCEPFHCHPEAFQCSDGKCIRRSYFCDYGTDCRDNSDERYCYIENYHVCPQGWSKCPNHPSCLPSHWMCDGYPDCSDGSDERNCGKAECDPKEFKCTNGNCVLIMNVCDGDNDCEDNSDEKVCDPFQCHPSAFQCLNGKCISRTSICDGDNNCGDNSDEQMCEPFQCHPLAFQCSNGDCLSRFDFCGYGDACGDNSDERYCNIGINDVCPEGWSECPNNRSCVPSHWMCDGYPDCPDAADERNCEPLNITRNVSPGSVHCAPTEFKCANGKCIEINELCDYGDDCGDNSDEEVCGPFQCHPSTFQCLTGKCIPHNWVCDGMDDCNDNSDEHTCELFQCPPSAFQCHNGNCIRRSQFCDDDNDCGDNTDERYCNIGRDGACPPGWSKCPNHQKCLPSHWICDKYPDCPDGSDERNCEPLNITRSVLPGSVECTPTEFKCKNGECIEFYELCDYLDNCGDNSDQEVCDPFQCHPSTSQCSNGKCVPHQWICDGMDDCGDNSDEKICEPFQCHSSAFQCHNGNCIRRSHFCDTENDCGDNTDERYCNIERDAVCPQGWSQCPNHQKCLPSHWMCDNYPDCPGGSDERNCDSYTRTTEAFVNMPDAYVNIPDVYAAKMELKSYLLSRRKSSSRTNHWGSQAHRIAVALHLADNSTFAPGNSTGEEIRYELTMQLLYRLPRNKMSSQELALYIHALLVSCLDPRDFYGSDLVRELRRRVEETENYTNPFLILVLCNAGDSMTARDVLRVTTAYDSQQRPFWTDSQALSSMALSCIASRNSGLVDERTLTDLLQELKKRQFRNGTVDNFRTTALVTQALFIHDSYKNDFNLDSAINVLIDGLNESKSLLNAYYVLPVLHGKSLLNVSSSHCSKLPVDEDEALQKALNVQGETIIVQYSIWMGDEANVGNTWRLRMPVNSTLYDAIETAAKIDNRQKVQYNVVDGKPYVASLNGKEDDPEMGTFWFIYLKALNSDEKPTLVEQSPADIKLTPNQEIILWYKSATWNDQNGIQELVSSS